MWGGVALYVKNNLQSVECEDSDLIEIFKIINGNYYIDTNLFFELDEGGRRGHSKNCLNEDVDWMLESLFMVIGLLTSGIVCLIVVLTVVH